MATPKNGQAHSNNSSVVAAEFLEWVWPFCGLALKGLSHGCKHTRLNRGLIRLYFHIHIYSVYLESQHKPCSTHMFKVKDKIRDKSLGFHNSEFNNKSSRKRSVKWALCPSLFLILDKSSNTISYCFSCWLWRVIDLFHGTEVFLIPPENIRITLFFWCFQRV